jgi:hypothetical protein
MEIDTTNPPLICQCEIPLVNTSYPEDFLAHPISDFDIGALGVCRENGHRFPIIARESEHTTVW